MLNHVLFFRSTFKKCRITNKLFSLSCFWNISFYAKPFKKAYSVCLFFTFFADMKMIFCEVRTLRVTCIRSLPLKKNIITKQFYLWMTILKETFGFKLGHWISLTMLCLKCISLFWEELSLMLPYFQSVTCNIYRKVHQIGTSIFNENK